MSTRTARPSLAEPSFLGLPYEIIRSIMVQCDYFSLHALRRTCTAVKSMIDNDPVFDAPLFRNRLLTNPTLTSDDLIKLRGLEPIGDSDDPYLYEGNPYINIHPALAQLFWDVDVDSYEDVVVKLTSQLTIDEVPHVLNECATCPPDSALRLTMSIALYRNRESFLIHKVDSNIPKVKPTQAKQQPILVGDVLTQLVLRSNRMYLRPWSTRYWYDYKEPEHDERRGLSLIRLTEWPEMRIYDDGELEIFFYFEPTSLDGL
ncbi:unnamed protein product [Tilletia laevis]|uniref:F-box domain-containing protein n=2 Tax=Tilletia TaxID=13289 RepID=A0A177V6H6_9BASI|nr:hypothetical protein CF336_g1938 [Tilletia laevis]KAE8263812.1 hypothetical protein A4X03_0g1401 [Tilletia caries]KAE8201939.1 hypothetical protein CF335_g3605 [Tilletia laevis]CAD6889938.1 unnamed protein product [Tilletia caries]CAD6904094.1 unnamed protein product [Tilletia caries]